MVSEPDSFAQRFSPGGPAAAVSAEAAAQQVMRVLPRAMDAMRLAMRAKLDGPLTVPQFRALNFVDRHPDSSISLYLVNPQGRPELTGWDEGSTPYQTRS